MSIKVAHFAEGMKKFGEERNYETPQKVKPGIRIKNPATKGDRVSNTYESGRKNKSRS